jgi:hypothetical protein
MLTGKLELRDTRKMHLSARSQVCFLGSSLGLFAGFVSGFLFYFPATVRVRVFERGPSPNPRGWFQAGTSLWDGKRTGVLCVRAVIMPF